MKRHVDRFCVAILILFFQVCCDLNAQGSLIRTYTVGEGLVMNRVRGFHQDKDGFIWMYTWDGLSRYEGYRFRNYIAGRDLRHSFVNDIFELPDSTLYLPLNDGSMAVMRHQEVQPQLLMPGAVINDFCLDDEGRLYAATDDSGIRLFENEKLGPSIHPDNSLSVQQIVFYQDHFFFIGPYSGPSGVFDRKMKMVAAWQGPPAFYSSMYKDYRNRIFVCTAEGLKEVDQSTSSFALKEASVIPKVAPWKNWNVNTVIVTPEDDFWIGTNQGLVHLRSDHSWSILTVLDGLISDKVNSLFVDKSNTLWIGTDAGAASINLQTRINEIRNLPGVYTNYVLPDQGGSVYVITGHAFLHHIDRHMKVHQSAWIKNSSNPPLGLVPRKNDMLLVRFAAVEPLDGKEFPFQHAGEDDRKGIYIQPEDNYWITTEYSFHCGQIQGKQQVLDTSIFVTAVAVARNNQLLIGTIQDGVFLARPEDHDPCKMQTVKDFSKWTEDRQIRSLMTSKNGDIWIGTRFSGVVRLQCDENYSNCAKQTYSITDGLVSNWITSITEDQEGNMWIGSASGVDKLIPRDDQYFVFSFSRINGYFASVRHLAVHSDRSLWVGHSEGLSRIVDGRIDTISPPVTFITEVNLGGKDYSSSAGSSVHLRYHQNSAHFAFAAPDFINSSQLTFTYRLLGSKDTSWSQPVKTHEIFYGNLTPGKFRFEVASFGWNGERGAPVSYAFEIMNPFWKQTWFILLSIILISGGAFGLYRFRIAQIHQVQAVRDRIAADLHDEIGSSLTHINILSEIGKQQHKEQNGAPNLFERIGTEVQTSSEALDDIIWSVRTKRDSIGDVIARMRQYATEIFDPAGISFQLNEHVEGIQSLEMEFKRDFYLVYKEILRNVLRHAQATRVDIHINVGRSDVSIQIRDNGKGFDVLAPTERNGLSNIRTRVKKWNGTVSWNSGQGKGTQVDVEMKPG